jgi:hypothetical protein
MMYTYRSSLLRSSLGVALALAATGLLALATSAPALANDFDVFVQCPLGVAEECVFYQSTGGSIAVGSKTVPLNTVTLQGGVKINPDTQEEEFVPAVNGETLSKTAQPLPGGLTGSAPSSWPQFVQAWYNTLIDTGHTGVTVTLELMNTPGISLQNLLYEQGTALTLPVRLQLKSDIVGEECYIGSKTSPIMINFTTGTTSPPGPNSPIEGTAGTVTLEDQDELVVIDGNQLVDNAFAAPVAEGCGSSYATYVDPLINSLFSLPSSAGHNTAELEGKWEAATAQTVLANL